MMSEKKKAYLKRAYFNAKNTTPSYYVYIVQCLDDSYYTGFASDLANRIVRHKNGIGSEYVKEKGFKKLVYFESHSSEEQAKQREIYIKKAGKPYKKMLVTEFQKNMLLLQ